MQLKPFDINYRSAEKFFQDYLQLKTGKLFVPAEDPLPLKTHLALNISVPRIDYAFQLNGIVRKIRDRKTAEKLEKPPGMLVHFQEDLEAFFENLDQKLLIDEKYQFLLALCETINDADSIMGEDIDETPAADDATSSNPAEVSTELSDQKKSGDQNAVAEAKVNSPQNPPLPSETTIPIVSLGMSTSSSGMG